MRPAALSFLLIVACESTPDRRREHQAARDVLRHRYKILTDDPERGYLLTEWLPQFDEWHDRHYRLRVEVVVEPALAVRVERQDRDGFSGQWTPQETDADEEERIRRDIRRHLR